MIVCSRTTIRTIHLVGRGGLTRRLWLKRRWHAPCSRSKLPPNNQARLCQHQKLMGFLEISRTQGVTAAPLETPPALGIPTHTSLELPASLEPHRLLLNPIWMETTFDTCSLTESLMTVRVSYDSLRCGASTTMDISNTKNAGAIFIREQTR